MASEVSPIGEYEIRPSRSAVTAPHRFRRPAVAQGEGRAWTQGIDSPLRNTALSEATYPSAEHAHLVTRTTFGPANHEWTGNDDVGEHHGPIDVNEVPCYLALYWQSKRAGRTVHVGTYKLNLHRLERGGYAREERGRKIRLRFVRESDGIVVIQINGSGPRLPVGRATFA